MTEGIFPFMYKPGVQKDGTAFQPEYCTFTQWMRFKNGKLRAMGGLEGETLEENEIEPKASSMIAVKRQELTLLFVGTKNKIIRSILGTNVFALTSPVNISYTVPENREIFWYAQIVIFDQRQHLVYLGTNNINNINDNSAPIFLSCELFNDLNLTNRDITEIGINPLSNGGCLYVSPFLFLYGSNGFVQWSASGKPFVFNEEDAGNQTISNDKVIFAASIRGGTNSPSILFWTLSSVVRLINVGQDNVEFKTDIVSKSSSILSSRSVVEYDGLFFWPGNERFFVYNGVVDELSNSFNQDLFYNNLDTRYSQNVVGVSFPRYGEIWWFYPEIVRSEDYKDLPPGINTRALIYNKKENNWYDTAISRDAAIYSYEIGSFLSYGKRLLKPSVIDNESYCWRHEYFGVNDPSINIESINLKPSSSIDRIFISPVISWFAFNPFGKPAGEDRWIELKRIEFDFHHLLDLQTNFSITFNTREYMGVQETYPIINFTIEAQPKLDINIEGKSIFFRLETDVYYEMGNTMLLIDSGDGQ